MQQLLIATIVLLSLGGTLAFPPRVNVTGLHYKQIFAQPIKFFQGAAAGRVIGGKECTAHSRPYEAYIVITGRDGQWLCGGALISNQYILTAGHCVDGGTSAQILLGAHNVEQRESTQVVYESQKLILHEGYAEETISNDIGLIKLSQSVALTSAIQTISLPSKSDASKTYEGETVTISGWGLTDGDSQEASSVLMEVDVKVISQNSCEQIFDVLQSYQLCTSGQDQKGACNGDSGSPLIHNGVAIGLVSYGAADCTPGYPSVFTNVGSFLEWVEKNSATSVA